MGVFARFGEAFLHPLLGLEVGLAAPLAGLARARGYGAAELFAGLWSEEDTRQSPGYPTEHESRESLLVQHPAHLLSRLHILPVLRGEHRTATPCSLALAGVQQERG